MHYASNKYQHGRRYNVSIREEAVTDLNRKQQ
jgi:hypothetical protein